MKRVPAALTRWLATAAPAGKVLIPGCGFGYEVRAFREAGWEVTALDYAPTVVERAKTILGELGDRVLLGDFFAHEFGQTFDLVYERTFLCALSPCRWLAYSRRVAELLRADGKLVGMFFYGQQDDPPPYPLTEAAAQATLGRYFVRTADEAVTDSLPLFAGRERWHVWEKR